MDIQSAADEYKDNLGTNLHMELYNKIGKRYSSGFTNESFFEKNESHFNNFVNGIAAGKISYITDFPLYLKSTKKIPIEIILQKTEEKIIDGKPIQINMFIVNLIKYAIMRDEDYYVISEKSLISISKLLKLQSSQILNLILNVNFQEGSEIKTFSEELPKMITFVRTDNHKRALLRCIAYIPNVIQKEEALFTNFFSEQLQISDSNHRLVKKTAASSASKIISIDPRSNFSKQIMANLPFDKEDPELSKYCFKALMAQCSIGEFGCFDLPQIIDFACDVNHRTSYDAVQLLRTASFNSIEICKVLLQYIDMFEYLLRNMEILHYVCSLIINIVSKGPEFANSFTFLFDSLISLYHENDLGNKISIVRTICSIILFSDIKFPKGHDPIYEILLDGIYLDNDVIIIIIDTLLCLEYTGEDFYQVLVELTESDDKPIAYQATCILNHIRQESEN